LYSVMQLERGEDVQTKLHLFPSLSEHGKLSEEERCFDRCWKVNMLVSL